MVYLFIFHFYHVETAGRVVKLVTHKVFARDECVFSALYRIHRFGRRAVRLARARFYFYKYKHVAVVGDYVDFAYLVFVIFIGDFIPRFFEIFYRELFAAAADNFFVKLRLCIGHKPFSFIAFMCAAVP